MYKYLFLYLTILLNINLAYGQELKLAGPAAVVSYPLMVMTEQQKLTDSAIKFSFTRWKSPINYVPWSLVNKSTSPLCLRT